MKFHSCACGKESHGMRCIYTGIAFEHDGEIYAGDMFFCSRCEALSIHGIPHATNPQCTPVARFNGLLYDETGHYMATDYNGVIELLPPATEYIQTKGCRSLCLEDYAI